MRTQSYHPKGKAVKTASIWPVLPTSADFRPRRKTAMKFNLQSRLGWSGLAVATAFAAEPRYKADVPASLITPDTVETKYLGDLKFVDGFPTDAKSRAADLGVNRSGT